MSGTAGDYSLSASYTWSPSQFPNPSFTTSTSGSALSGAKDASGLNNNPLITTYQYNTRDTFGMAIKATYGRINGAPVDMYKDPKTDSGMKKSAKGLLRVNADLTLSQQVTLSEERQGLLKTIFLDGETQNFQTLAQIRERLLSNLP
jgi:hypothetical protein